VPGPTEPGPHSEPTTTPPFCLPLALPSRESFSRITPEVRFSLRACVIVRCDVHCILLCTVQVPTHISVLSSALFPGVAANPHARHTSSTFSHLAAACTDRGASERAPASTTPSSLFFFLVGPLLQPSWESFTPYKYRPTVSVTVLLTITRSLRLTPVACDSHSPVNPSVPAQSTACCLVTRTCSFPTSRHCIHSRSRNL
jgi:hypothetical protein